MKCKHKQTGTCAFAKETLGDPQVSFSSTYKLDLKQKSPKHGFIENSKTRCFLTDGQLL